MKESVTEMFWRENPDEVQERKMEDAYSIYYTKKQISMAKNPKASTKPLTQDFIAELKSIFGVK